jgi:hypothetical protein
MSWMSPGRKPQVPLFSFSSEVSAFPRQHGIIFLGAFRFLLRLFRRLG